MAISEGPPRDASDYEEMWRLVQSYPDQQRHVVDLPYRLCSPSATTRRDVRIWRTHHGELVGWAILQWEFWTLDYAILPGPTARSVAERILMWAIGRCGALAAERGEPLRLFVDVRKDGPPPALPLCRYSADDARFALYPDWRQYHLERPADLPPRQPKIPKGFAIRSLAGMDEVDAYVDLHHAAFQSTNMTREWREAILRSPHYTPDVDLVAVAPNGALAGFCVCWLNRAAQWATGPEITGQVEPIGVSPENQGRGLGRALLFEGVSRMAAHGARRMFIEVDAGNEAALALYLSAGFRVRETILKDMLAVPPHARVAIDIQV